MLGEQDKGSRQKTMTVMGAGLEILVAGRAGQRKSAEDNDGDGSWAGDINKTL